MMLEILSTPDEDTIWPSLSNHCAIGSRLEFVLSQMRNSVPPSLTVVTP
ncbi:hypothetical protein GBAR_LOCUS14559, partial [Geodia barretti]